MMNILYKTVVVFTLLFNVAHSAEFNTLRTEQSRVDFGYKQMNVPMEGRFKRISGQLRFDPAAPAYAKVTLDIDLTSIDTGSAEGDEEVANKQWFNTKQFPAARFVSTSVKPLGNNRFQVTGKMSIKGKTHDVTTPTTFSQHGAAGVFDGSFMLKRADYGIGEGMWTDFGTVANDVQIKFRLVALAAGKK